MIADVTVNLMWLRPGRVGGSEEYLVRQLTGLLDHVAGPGGPDGALTLAVQPTFAAAHPGLAARCRLMTAPTGVDRQAVRVAIEHTWLARQTRGAGLVHHAGGTVPLTGAGPRVVTVHDLQFRRFPHYFGRARRSYLAAMVPRAVGRADVVTVPTEYVRATVVDAYGVAPERVVVVPHGVPRVASPGPAAVAAARSRTGIGDRPYVVYPAITHPHKGHRLLVDMLDHLTGDLRGLGLVLIGGQGPAEPDLRRAIAASVHRDRIARPGRVDAATRDALVAGAEALVFPSEYEGFGAPLVEAMALGTPVVASEAGAVREVVGGAALVVTTATGEAWAEGVTTAIADRDRLVDLGARRRRDFTAARSGAALAGAYRSALDPR